MTLMPAGNPVSCHLIGPAGFLCSLPARHQGVHEARDWRNERLEFWVSCGAGCPIEGTHECGKPQDHQGDHADHWHDWPRADPGGFA
jgi:hypothetical protein